MKAAILERVRRRDWAAGDLLPPETELAAAFGCARATVNRALRELAEEGVLERKRRAGTRVSAAQVRRPRLEIPLTRAEIEATGAGYRYVLVARTEETVPPWLAATLAIDGAARAVRVEAVHYAGSRPWQVEERWILLDAVPEAREQDFAEAGPNEWLVGRVPFSEAELAFSAARADRGVAAFLGIEPGDPVFRAVRTTWLDGRPVTHVRLSYPPEYRLVMRL